MDLSEEARSILETAGYRVFSERRSILHLESDVVMGFVAICETSAEIVNYWRERQSQFLRRNATALRESGLKSWNVYSVFLAEFSDPNEHNNRLLEIEEDFQSTRKIAQSNLLSRADVVRALLPLLPLQNFVQLKEDDPISRLRTRVQDRIVAALQQSKSVEELTSLFLNLQ